MVRHLYIHVPFCHRICPYCSFYKHTPGGYDHRAFVDALLAELDNHLASFGCRPSTIYLGGGTPTALSRTHLDVLLTGLAQRLDLEYLEEWDIEANPKTFGEAKAELMRAAGVTRISLGVQSWQEQTLGTLGRDHSPTEAENAYRILREQEFPSVNIDLMFSVPGQSRPMWREDLARTADLAPDHVSAYNLNYEEDTEFFERLQRGELDADGERDADMFAVAIDVLGQAGFEHYEISNYARPGHRSRHNAAYWSGADYLGIGPGAFSTVGGERWRNVPDTAAYIRAVSSGALRRIITEHETIDAEAFRRERVALELRTSRGVSIEHIGDLIKLEELGDRGLVTTRVGRATLTAEGKFLADPIAAELI